MKWIEFIRVRSSTATLKEAIPFLKKGLDEINTSESIKETFMVKHALYNEDLSVIVVWNNNVKPEKTREGLLLAERLQDFGQVDHAVWIPLTESDP